MQTVFIEGVRPLGKGEDFVNEPTRTDFDEAWAQVFGDLANALRKDAELEKGEDE